MKDKWEDPSIRIVMLDDISVIRTSSGLTNGGFDGGENDEDNIYDIFK